MAILLGIVIFVLTFDQYNFTKTLYRPIVSCAIVGAILGNLETGVTIGCSFELLLLAFESTSVSTFSTEGYFLGAIAAVILSIVSSLDSYTAISYGSVIGIVACVIHGAIVALATMLLPIARKNVEKEKSLTLLQFLPLVIEGIVFVAMIELVYQGQETFITNFSSAYESTFGWVIAGFGILGKLLPALGLAVLARNLSFKDYPGAFCIGIVLGAIFVQNFGETSLLLSSLCVIGLSMYDYRHMTDNNQPVLSITKQVKTYGQLNEETKAEKAEVLQELKEEKPVIEEKPPMDKEVEPIKESEIQPLKLEQSAEKQEALKKMDEESKVKGDEEVWW